MQGAHSGTPGCKKRVRFVSVRTCSTVALVWDGHRVCQRWRRQGFASCRSSRDVQGPSRGAGRAGLLAAVLSAVAVRRLVCISYGVQHADGTVSRLPNLLCIAGRADPIKAWLVTDQGICALFACYASAQPARRTSCAAQEP